MEYVYCQSEVVWIDCINACFFTICKVNTYALIYNDR